MTFITRNLKETATYWPPGVNDGFGNVGFSSPVTINVRWEEKNELFIDNQGNQSVSNAVVYSDTDVESKGYLYLGTSSSTDPSSLDGAYEIRRFNKTPSLSTRIFERKVFL